MVYWDLGHIESPIRTNVNSKVCIHIPTNTTENYPHRFTGSGSSHLNQVGILGSWVHGISHSHQI